jgi:hypothetical protein
VLPFAAAIALMNAGNALISNPYLRSPIRDTKNPSCSDAAKHCRCLLATPSASLVTDRSSESSCNILSVDAIDAGRILFK